MTKPKPRWDAQVSDVQIDKTKIAVLCKYPAKLSSTIHFLGKRQISTVAFNNMKEFVAAMETGVFEFIVISLSFHHPNIERVAVVMEQMYKKTVIVFVEDFEKGSSLLLQNSHYKYRITGQISGPALEMTIARAIKELATASGTTNPEIVSNQTNKSVPEAKGKFVVSARGAKGQPGVYVDKGQKIETELLSLINPEGTSFKETQADPTAKTKGHKATQVAPESKQNLPRIVPTAKAERPRAAIPQNESKARAPHPAHQQRDPSATRGALIVPIEQAEKAAMKANRRRFKKGQALHRAIRPEADAMTLWMCANDTLDAISRGKQGKALKAVANPAKCVLLSMETEFASGTFAFLISDCGDKMETVVGMLTEELFTSMEKRSLGRPAEDEFDIFEVEEGLMREEVLERARMRSAREGLLANVEIAYLDHADMITQVEFDDIEVKDVPLHSITPEMPLDFHLFLKLPLNRRYLRYVNEQRRLSENQVVRLTSYGVRTAFVEAEHYEKYLVHSARAQLDEELKKRSMRLIKKKRGA